ncbi:hypothetical protein MHU86_5006 [Fragilaria crotonensis]|nr:hypothetical protein MHU86_5006 [Fragilaria crotonensis]
MVSYEDYQAMVAAEDPVIVPMCFLNPKGPLKKYCGKLANMYRREVNPLLKKARQRKGGTTVIHIKYYRQGGFLDTKVGGKKLVDVNRTELILAKHFAFARHHYDIVDYLLRLMGISTLRTLM